MKSPWILTPLFLAALLTAQGPTGTITGIVTDSSNAVVGGAIVRLLNPATGVSREAATNDEGAYTFPALPPGAYTVSVEKPGFQRQSRPDLLLQVQQTARLDFILQVGDVNQSVDVRESAPLLASEDATVGQVIENKRIVELPLNGRNFLQLTALSPGVNINSSAGGSVALQGGLRSAQTVVVNGQRSAFNHYTLDGIENTDPNFNSYVLLPSIDALQEFKVQSATYPSEYGFAVSQINISTKSGTNELHGSLFSFVRNSYFDAKNYFAAPNQPIPPFRRNQFGGTVGGPVWRNKLFYLGNYEGLREVKAITQTSTVPLPAQRAGNFAGGRPIFDPLTRATTGGVVTAQPFAGNIVPENRITTKSKRLLEFIPLPNQPGVARNYLNTEAARTNSDQFLTRADYRQNDQLLWFGRWNYTDDSEYTPSPFFQQGRVVGTRADQVLFGSTWVVRSNLVNDARFGWTRFRNNNVGFNSFTRDVNKELQINGFNPSNDPAFWGVPEISITGFTGAGEPQAVALTNNTQYELHDTASWVKGKHTFRFGGTFKPIHYNQLGNQFARGGFTFDNFATQNPQSPATSGFGVADLLLGYPFESRTGVLPANAQLRSTYYAAFLADSWKISPRLTLEWGLRYEVLPAFRDINDNSVNVFGLVGLDGGNPILVRGSNQGSGRDPYENQVVRFSRAQLVRDGRLPNSLVHSDRNNWAPRLGLAWSLNNKTVIRAGFGTFYAVLDTGNSIYDMSRTLAGLLRETNSSQTLGLTVERPFTTTPGSGTITLGQATILANSADMRSTYVNQWSFNVQRSVSSSLVLEAGYVGSQSHRLKKVVSVNMPRPGAGGVDARRPFQQFGYVQFPNSIGNGNYHALQLKLEHRFRAGFTLLSGYTFAKAIDDTSGFRPGSGDTLFPNDPYVVNSLERGRSAFDSRHRWITSALYEFPFFKGGSRLSRMLLGGWQLGGIFTAESGYPVTPSIGSDTPNVGVGSTPRPNATGVSPVISNPNASRWFNLDAFSRPAPFVYGNAGRNVIGGPGIVNLDLSLTKNFRITEQRYAQFRWEVFNAANHPILGVPNASVVSPAYGTIGNTRIDSRQMQLALRLVF